MVREKFTVKRIGLPVILFSCIFLLCFYKLGVSSIENWDEARHGVSGYEMVQTKEYVVTTYQYETDYWNLKPPLSEYFIGLGYKIFGYSALGLRAYSAISMLLCVGICYIYTRKRIGELASIMVLCGFIACTPLWEFHCARAGDADSLYILFYTIVMLCLSEYKRHKGMLYIASFCFSLAFLTKSWHAGTIPIIMFLFLFFSGELKKFSVKRGLGCILAGIMPIGVWGIFRSMKDGSDFFRQMFLYDLLKRSGNVLDEHEGNAFFYFGYFFQNIGCVVSFLFCVILFYLLFHNKIKGKEIFNSAPHRLVTVLSTLVVHIMFGCAKTKLEWYIFCTLPMIIILAGEGAAYLYQARISVRKKRCFFVFLLFFYGVAAIGNIQNVCQTKSGKQLCDNILANFHREEKWRKQPIYLQKDKTTKWEQREVLALELAGDMIPCDGGRRAWEKSGEGYLLVSDKQLVHVKVDYQIEKKIGTYLLIFTNHI